MEAKDVTKTELKKVAKEFNEQMGLEPPILLDLTVKALKAKCIEAAAQIDLEQDEYSDEVWEILGALGCDPRVEVSNEDTDQPDDEPGDAQDKDETVVEGEDADAAVEEAMEDTLVEDFKAAKKLAELKELAQEWECFEKLDLDSYAGLQGPKKLRAAMLDCMPDELREQIEPKPVEKTAKPAKEKKVKASKSPGVIATIATAIEDAGENGISKEEILEKLVTAFPDREADRMKKTINVQVPTRISKEKFKVRVENGRYFKE